MRLGEDGAGVVAPSSVGGTANVLSFADRLQAAMPKSIFGVGLDLGIPLLLLVVLGAAGLLLYVFRPAERAARRRRRDKRIGSKRTSSAWPATAGRGKHVRLPTEDQDQDVEEGEDMS